MDNSIFLKNIEECICRNPFPSKDKDYVLRQYFNEASFSNILAWLLDPKGSHGFGVKFANEFLKCIAKRRTTNNYARKGTFLKWGKGGKGKPSTQFSLKNSSAIREFYLPQTKSSKSNKVSRYCDVVLMDIDSKDSLFVSIENKLFTANHPFQLKDCYQIVEQKFARVKIREYVYLTIHGNEPLIDGYENYWIRMSWVKDIASILSNLETNNQEIVFIRDLLAWIQNICQNVVKTDIEQLRAKLLYAASQCLKEELNRLAEGITGKWIRRDESKRDKLMRYSIYHTSFQATPLYIELLPNNSITVQSQRNNKPLFDKIIVPFGANADQIFNLFDITARDIYNYHFPRNSRYLPKKRRMTVSRTQMKEQFQELFEFAFKYQPELKILFGLLRSPWEAVNYELQESAEKE